MPRRYFEDFTPGQVEEYGPRTITREEIIAFAVEYDPQPMHLDEAAARESMLGGLMASGWHTCGVMMRLLCDGFLLDAASMGSPGVDEIKWLKPVRPGDALSVRMHVLESRPSASRPVMGLVKLRYDVLAAGTPVMQAWSTMMIGRRDAAAAS